MMTQNYKIFINIAAYDDMQLLRTLASLTRNSSNMSRIFVSICWQSDTTINVTGKNIAMQWLGRSEARGVGYARSLAHNLYDGQDFYLTIDAHTLFSPGWDDQILSDYFGFEKSIADLIIISSYAPGWSEYPNGKARKLICKDHFNQYGIMRFRAEGILREPTPYPPISCHFMFSRGRFFLELPHDPNIFYNGEEITYTIRAFTHGWVNVQPSTAYLYHKYNSKNNPHPTIWKHNKNWSMLNNPSVARVLKICNSKPDNLGHYGKGTVKTLKELEGILKLDFNSLRIL